MGHVSTKSKVSCLEYGWTEEAECLDSIGLHVEPPLRVWLIGSLQNSVVCTQFILHDSFSENTQWLIGSTHGIVHTATRFRDQSFSRCDDREEG